MLRFKEYGRRFSIIVLSVFLYSGTVQAGEISGETTNHLQKEKSGSISITLPEGEEGTSRENVVFSYAKVANLVDGNYQGIHAGEGIAFEDIQTAEDLKNTAVKLKGKVQTPDGEVKTDADGKAILKNLEEGVYLLYVSNQAEYENVDPLLVAIPTWNEL